MSIPAQLRSFSRRSSEACKLFKYKPFCLSKVTPTVLPFLLKSVAAKPPVGDLIVGDLYLFFPNYLLNFAVWSFRSNKC